jgi:hypothetical protein
MENMSLLVNVYTGPRSSMEIIEPDQHWQELAGFESYRQCLYGSQAARDLGLQLLPNLARGDLYAEGEDVDRLRAEAELAVANIELFVAEAGATEESLLPRFTNIIAATRLAAKLGGGVVIW